MRDQKKRDRTPPKEVRQQLDGLLESGQSLHYEQDVALSPQDIGFIKSMFLKVVLFCLVASSILGLVIYLFQEEDTVWVVGGVLLLFQVFLLVRASLQLFANLRSGKKTIVRGIITDRYTKKLFGPEDEDGRRDEKTLHYLQVGTREFEVSSSIYKSHKIGKAIELQYILSYKGKPYFLHHRTLKDAGVVPRN